MDNLRLAGMSFVLLYIIATVVIFFKYPPNFHPKRFHEKVMTYQEWRDSEAKVRVGSVECTCREDECICMGSDSGGCVITDNRLPENGVSLSGLEVYPESPAAGFYEPSEVCSEPGGPRLLPSTISTCLTPRK